MAAYSAIDNNRAFSTTVVDSVVENLANASFAGVRSVSVAGSFGRLEASQASDADFIIVLTEDVIDLGIVERRAIETPVIEAMRQEFDKFGIEPPNPEGVFAAPRTLGELMPPLERGGIGSRDEPSDVMGKRLLLLLESRAVWGVDAYEDIIDQIYNRYAQYVLNDHSKEHVYLLNDLIRYFRYICVNYQSTFGNQNEKWAIRNMKLRHSRLLMYGGLLALLGNASRYRDHRKTTMVRDQLSLTPLERLEFAYDESGDYSFFKIAGLYNAFLMRLSDPGIRDQLNAIEYDERYTIPSFASLKANSDAFQSELTNFLFRRQGQWSDRFFEYLLF